MKQNYPDHPFYTEDDTDTERYFIFSFEGLDVAIDHVKDYAILYDGGSSWWICCPSLHCGRFSHMDDAFGFPTRPVPEEIKEFIKAHHSLIS